MTQRTGFEKIVDIFLRMPGMRQNLTIFSLSNLLVFFSIFSLITVHEVNCDMAACGARVVACAVAPQLGVGEDLR